jgi:hypothetical protein
MVLGIVVDRHNVSSIKHMADRTSTSPVLGKNATDKEDVIGANYMHK